MVSTAEEDSTTGEATTTEVPLTSTGEAEEAQGLEVQLQACLVVQEDLHDGRGLVDLHPSADPLVYLESFHNSSP